MKKLSRPWLVYEIIKRIVFSRRQNPVRAIRSHIGFFRMLRMISRYLD